MIKRFEGVEKFTVRGKIKTGFKAIKAECPTCKKKIIGFKADNAFYCPDCGSPASPIKGEKEFTQSTPYFVVPEEVRQRLGDKPGKLKVVPAYRDIEKTFPNSYARFTQSGKIMCQGDGETAKRYNQGKHEQVLCSEDCPDRKNRACKACGTLYVIIPDIDVFSCYAIVTHSEQSIENILSALYKLRGADGMINRTVCTLELIEKRRVETNSSYRVLQLSLPSVSLSELQSGRTLTSLEWTGSGSSMPGVSPIVDTNTATVIYEEGGPIGEGEAQKDNKLSPAENERVIKGRTMVRQKLKEFLKGPNIDQALEMYACQRFGVGSFDELSVEQLLELWHGIIKVPAIVDEIWKISTELSRGQKAGIN